MHNATATVITTFNFYTVSVLCILLRLAGNSMLSYLCIYAFNFPYSTHIIVYQNMISLVAACTDVRTHTHTRGHAYTQKQQRIKG